MDAETARQMTFESDAYAIHKLEMQAWIEFIEGKIKQAIENGRFDALIREKDGPEADRRAMLGAIDHFNKLGYTISGTTKYLGVSWWR